LKLQPDFQRPWLIYANLKRRVGWLEHALATYLPIAPQDGICVSKGVLDQDNNNFISTAEAATLQLEFKYLSYLADEDGYWRAAEKVGSARLLIETLC
jgi:hypothetical protein